MKSNIIIREKSDRVRLVQNKFCEWFLYMVCYAVVLIFISFLFKSISINLDYFGLYAFIAAVIIYVLNQTIKPVLFYLTLPITALTMGLFYPILNLLVLYLASFILGKNFEISGIIIPFFIAILISFLNILMEGIVIRPIVKRNKKE